MATKIKQTIPFINLNIFFNLSLVILSFSPSFSQIKKSNPPVFSINTAPAVGCTRLTDINSLVPSSNFVLPAFVNSSDLTFPAGGNSGCLSSVPNQYWFLVKIDSLNAGTLNFNFTNSSNYDIDGAIYGPLFNNDLNYSCSAISNSPVSCDFGAEPNVDLTLTNLALNQYYIIVLTNYSNQNTNINISQPIGGRVNYYRPDDCVVKTALIEGNYSINSGQTSQLKLTFSVIPPVNLSIENYGEIIVTSNPQYITVSPINTTQYRILTANDTQCGVLTTSGLATVEVQSSINKNKLISCFEFDNNFLDEKGINQAFNTSVGFTSDRYGNPNRAALFNGNNYLSVTSNEFINSQFTFSAWVKFNSIPPSNTYTSLFSVGNDGGDQSFGVMHNYGANFTGNRPKWVMPNYIGYSQAGPYPMANDTLVIDAWNLVTMTRGSDSLKIYINGTKKAAVSANGSSPYYSGSIAKIGSRYFGGQSFDGAMDELKIFSGVLTEEEVKLLYLKQTCNYEYLNNRDRKTIVCLPFENGFQEVIGNISIIQTNLNLSNDRLNNVNFASQFNESSLLEMSSPLLFPQTYSTSLWFYPSSSLPVQTLFSIGASPFEHYLKLENSARTGNLFKLVFSSNINNGGVKSISISNEISLNTWHHVLVVREQQRIIVYLDGIKVKESDFINTFPNYFGSNPKFYIGSNFGTEKFIGKIDDFKFFSGPVFDSEAKAIYSSNPNNCTFTECPPIRKVQGIYTGFKGFQSSVETEVLNHDVAGSHLNFFSEKAVILKPGSQFNKTIKIEIKSCVNDF